MQIFRTLAGYSLGRADVVRRAMSKKKHDVMERERNIFLFGLTDENGNVQVEGCVRRGVPEKVGRAIFEEMSSFASYAFNKSHAAAYALIAYRTACLKHLYPQEYMAALLTSVMDGGRLVSYIGECGRLGIEVLPPSVNAGGERFTAEGKAIRFGLLAVKNLGRGLIASLVADREQNGPFTDFFDFCRRMSGYKESNRRALESLIRCGALDGMGANRRQMLSVYGNYLDSLEQVGRTQMQGQLDLFGEQKTAEIPPLPPEEEFSYEERLAMEKELTGLYLSGNPLEPYLPLYDRLPLSRIGELIDEPPAQEAVTVLGLVSEVRRKATRSDAQMAYVTLEDLTGSMEALVFPRVLACTSSRWQKGQVLLVRGRLTEEDGEAPKLIAESAETPSVIQAPAKVGTSHAAPGLYVQIPSQTGEEWTRVQLVLRVFEGTVPVTVKFVDTGKCVRGRAQTPPPLIAEMERIAGENNVVLIK